MTTCKQCHRAVNVTDVDKEGLCCFCQAKPAPKTQAQPS